MRVTPTFIIMFYGSRLLHFLTPHRYPVPGKTKVRVSSYTHRYRIGGTEVWTGTVLEAEHHHEGPFEQKRGYEREGVYFQGDPRWDRNWVVRLDDEAGTVEQHARVQYISGYRWGIPALHRLIARLQGKPISDQLRRVGDLRYPIECYPGDFVVYAQDKTKTPRMVTSFWLGLDGKVTYSLAETLSERTAQLEEAKREAEATGRSYAIVSGPQLKYHQVTAQTLTLTRRGNYYHLAEGKPEDLTFPHVALEVDFWRNIGIWLETPKLSTAEAQAQLLRGEIDAIPATRDSVHHSIRLPERFAPFRERSRAASLQYLAEFAGKYSFEVVPKAIRREYEQSDF